MFQKQRQCYAWPGIAAHSYSSAWLRMVRFLTKKTHTTSRTTPVNPQIKKTHRAGAVGNMTLIWLNAKSFFKISRIHDLIPGPVSPIEDSSFNEFQHGGGRPEIHFMTTF